MMVDDALDSSTSMHSLKPSFLLLHSSCWTYHQSLLLYAQKQAIVLRSHADEANGGLAVRSVLGLLVLSIGRPLLPSSR